MACTDMSRSPPTISVPAVVTVDVAAAAGVRFGVVMRPLKLPPVIVEVIVA